MLDGVNFFGPYQARDSIGRSAGLNISCLESSGIPHDVHLMSRPNPKEIIDYGTIDEDLVKSLKYNINIFHFNARRVPQYFSRISKNSLKDFHNIGFWVHEMQAIPDAWAQQLEYFDEIWTPSSLCQNSVAYLSNIPVLKFPYAVKINHVTEKIEKISRGCQSPVFKFLTIFDVYSDAERKNPLFAIRAFLNAYAKNLNVQFIIKTRNLSYDEKLREKLKSITEKFPNVIVIDTYITDEDLNNLYGDADAYVSLHRAEGFGLTISDAMSRGIPVITTGYSGNIDFCNAAETRLVAYTLRKVGHDRPRYRREDVWAEPDLIDATAAFTDLVNNHSAWVCKAALARNRLIEEYSIYDIGQKMKKRIELINRKFKFADDMSGRKIDYEVGISESYGF
jgi:glycosyltransferase involved in cell wall biosynthesis